MPLACGRIDTGGHGGCEDREASLSLSAGGYHRRLRRQKMYATTATAVSPNESPIVILTACTISVLLEVPWTGTAELVGTGVPNMGREAVGGSVIEGRNTEVAGLPVTLNMRGPISSRVGDASGMKVTTTVEVWDSWRLRTETIPTEELKTAAVIEPLFDTVMLAVAFDREEV